MKTHKSTKIALPGQVLKIPTCLAPSAPAPNSNPVQFQGSMILSACNTHAQTPCPENQIFRGCTIQTSNTANQSYAPTAAQTSGACPDDPQQNPNQKLGNTGSDWKAPVTHVQCHLWTCSHRNAYASQWYCTSVGLRHTRMNVSAGLCDAHATSVPSLANVSVLW